MGLTQRAALPEDYPVFARLFPELETGDPLPSEEWWRTEIAPQTWLFEQESEVAGYLYAQTLAGAGYIRHVVVAPGMRGRGVGRAMMLALAARLQERGCSSWCLNVKPGNKPAVRLYQAVGMRRAYSSASVRFTWALVDRLEPVAGVGVVGIEASEDAAIQRAYGLPAGQLTAARENPGARLVRLHDPARPERVDLGFAAFYPGFPGAFPFRVADPSLAAPLLAGLRPMARPEVEAMGVVAESDPGLVALLTSVGGKVVLEFDHYEGDPRHA